MLIDNERVGGYDGGMSKQTDLSKQLRDAIQASGQSLNQLGHAAEVDAGRLSRFMRGERSLTLEAVSRLCQALGLKFCPAEEDAGQAEPESAKKTRTRKEQR